MSYFSEVYGDPELSAKAKLVLVYLHDRANKDGKSWYAIATMAKGRVKIFSHFSLQALA